MAEKIYQPLSRPAVYRLAQWLLAPGAMPIIDQWLRRLVAEVPAGEPLLDVGCGPSSLLFRIGLKPAGLDLSSLYVSEYVKSGARGVVGSAGALPFAEGSFHGVWSIGLLHHLPAELARKAVAEMWRVCARGGYVVVLDGVRPASAFRRPVAALVRQLDRGRFMRLQEELEALFPETEAWTRERFSYSWTGLEMLSCWRVKK